MVQKPLKNDFRAIKTTLAIGFAVVFLIFGIFFTFSKVSANYNQEIGTSYGNQNISSSTKKMWYSLGYGFSGSSTGTQMRYYRSGTANCTFYAMWLVGYNSEEDFLTGETASTSCASSNPVCSGSATDEVVNYDLNCTFNEDLYYVIQSSFNLGTGRIVYMRGSNTKVRDPSICLYGANEETAISCTVIVDEYFQIYGSVGEPALCDYDNFYDCAVASCYWYNSPFGDFCSDIIFGGECGNNWFSCSSCENEIDCEDQENCYWFQNTCNYGTGACGEGVLLQFCENFEDCNTNSGYWYEDFCWSEPETEIISWYDYYTDNGEYATASTWVLSLASTTSTHFKNVAGFLSGFNNFFDLQTAYQKGLELGGIIPTARGYLFILDSFAGGLPFSLLFIFSLIFLLAVGVFRIVRNLLQILKFW